MDSADSMDSIASNHINPDTQNQKYNPIYDEMIYNRKFQREVIHISILIYLLLLFYPLDKIYLT